MNLLRAGLSALALLLAAGAAHAQAPAGPPTVMMRLDPPAQLPAGPQVVRRNTPLLELAARLPTTVRLQADVDASAVNAVGAKLKRPLKAGQILIGAPTRKGTWCAPVRSGLLFAVAPCLIDADNDGLFEAATTVSFIANGAEDFAITEDNEAIGVLYAKSAPLLAPAIYSPASVGDGVPAKARLRWQVVVRPKTAPPGPTMVAFWLEAGDDASGTAVYSKPEPIALAADGTGEGMVAGVRLKILGFDDKKSLKYEVLGAQPVEAQPFLFQGAPQTFFVYF